MKRSVATFVFLVCLAELAWLGMQIVHELGHLLTAWITGRAIVDVVLHPLRISETVIEPKPVPAGVVWAGPLFGSIIPAVIWMAVSRIGQRKSLTEACVRFFAGFCLIANGAYLGMGVWIPVGDALDLIQQGTPVWQLGLFGVVMIPLGLLLWDGLRPRLGIGRDADLIPPFFAMILGVLLALVLLLEWNFG